MKRLMISKIVVTVFTLVSSTPVIGQIKVTTSNNIGIGTDNPIYPVTFDKAQVYLNGYQSSNRSILFKVSDAHPRVYVDSKLVFYKLNESGWASLEALSFNTMSDERLKTNITKLSGLTAETSALQTVLRLNGYVYNWKQDMVDNNKYEPTAKRQVGFLAQEVEKLIPEAVSTSNDSTEMKSVAYMQIIPYLVEAIKEQQQTIDVLKAEIGQLKGKAVSARKNEDGRTQESDYVINIYNKNNYLNSKR